LQKLVQTPSANPFTKEPLKSSPYTPVELEVAELIYDKLHEIGLQPKFVGVSHLRPNVVVKFGKGKKTLIFNGHMDTVTPSRDYSFNPYSGIIQDGKLYGVGSYDMKASLAAYIAMAEILLKCEDRLNGEVQLQFVVDEETMASSPFGTQYLLDLEYTGDAAIVGEPGTYKICIGNKTKHF
jgi:acetylornithine deacetylase/succinyl-diaminopimelate desuccinylase-like protein